MTYEIGVACGIVAGAAAMLLFTRRPPDIILVEALTCLLLLGIATPAQALSGLANPGLATVGVLNVVVAGLVDTGKWEQDPQTSWS
jgi:di/tricarboxylate transporter